MKAMIVADKQKILCRDEYPTRITAIIPTAKIITYKGVELVVVPHKVEETRVLRNLGYDVQSPIGLYYNFPIRKGTPFYAQRVTSDMLTLYDRMFVLNQIGCVDSETEFLSPTGWIKISEYAGEGVAQYHPETGKADFVFDAKYVKLPCDKMIKIKTKYGIDQLVSPEHRVLLNNLERTGKQEVVSAAELYTRQMSQTKKSREKIGFQQAAIPVTFDGCGGIGLALTDAELRVQIAVVADGHFPPNNTNRCIVRLKKQRKKDRLRAILKHAGITWKEREQNTATAQGFTIFRFIAPMRVKEFDIWAWDMTPAQLYIVCDEVMNWDGSVSEIKPTERFSSYSKKSADFVQYAFSSTGRTARLTTSYRDRDGKKVVEYEVRVRDNGNPLGLAGTSGGKKTSPMTVENSTDGYKYCFMVPSTFLVLRRNGCVFCTGNTGKTLSVLWAYEYLKSQGLANKLLVVCPLSTMERVWADEVYTHLPKLQTVVLYGSRQHRLDLLNVESDIYIINHDGVEVIEDALKARPDIDSVVIDEIAVFRNASTDRFRALKRTCASHKRVWGLTGTPTPNRPTDAWAQCQLISPGKVPKYFGQFRDLVERKVTQFKWVPREGALEIVRACMQPAVLFKRDECIDLPPTMYVERYVEMTAEQRKAYKQMVTTLVADAENGSILAVNEAVKAAKLAQIACGVAYDRTGENVYFDCENRINVLKEIIEESEGKVIVFIPLTGGLEMLAEKIGKEWSVVTVHGQVGKTARDEIFGSFMRPGGPEVLIAHPRCMAHGLTLVEANTIVWFIPTNSHEEYEQANGRIVRPGQIRNTFIIHLEGSEIERRMYKRLKNKSSMQNLLLELIKEEQG